MFVQLKSTNPNMSWVIQKNPASGMIIENHKKGNLFGWFSGNDDHYNIYFEDDKDEISYKHDKYQEFEYLDASRYISSKIPMNMLSELLKTARDEVHEEDVKGYTNTIMINMMSIYAHRYLNIFKKHFEDRFSMEFEHINHKNYRITISTDNTIHELLNLVNLFCLFNTLANDDAHFFVDDNNIRKYLKVMNKLDAPYFIRYLFKVKVIRSKEMFETIKDELEGSDDVDMEFGDTWESRYNAIKDEISFSKDIVDVGCAEGRYGRRLINTLKKNDLNYIGIDPSEEAVKTARKKLSFKTDDHFTFYSYWDEFAENKDGREKEVILSEVIEHMEKEEARKLIEKILSHEEVGKLIITTPNKDFNPFYNMEEDMRREDHIFEPTEKEFSELMESVNSDGFSAEQKQIGDSVEDIKPTHMIVFEKELETVEQN